MDMSDILEVSEISMCITFMHKSLSDLLHEKMAI